MFCKECDQEFKVEKSLHLHIAKKHKILLTEYYQKHFPRFDFYDKKSIEFSDTEDYFQRDFNSKENFSKWCFEADPDTVKKYIVQAFKRRCQKKKTNFIPSQLELKTLFLPSFVGIKKIFGNLSDFLEKIEKEGLYTKYNYTSNPIFSNETAQILIDTREQNPLFFKHSGIVKLSCGDYTVQKPLYSDVFIERKSLPDLVSTISNGINRFKREIQRAKDLEYYLVVVVEDKFSNALEWSPENSFSKFVNGKFIFYRIREICHEFNNIQFLFSDSRENSQKIIPKIFQLKDSCQNFDLEFLKDFKQI